MTQQESETAVTNLVKEVELAYASLISLMVKIHSASERPSKDAVLAAAVRLVEIYHGEKES